MEVKAIGEGGPIWSSQLEEMNRYYPEGAR
jgi:hypothetical protein